MPTIPNVDLPAEVVAPLLALPPDQLRTVAAYLLEFADVPDPGPPDDPEEVRQAWKAELGRRIDAYLAGKVQTLDARGSVERLRLRLREEFGYDV